MEGKLEEKIRLQIDSLQQALARLKEALGFENAQVPARLNIDAAIQRFEFTYELAWKLMQSIIRYKGKDCQSPRDCFRTAAQIELIDDPTKWIEYLDARNLTVHTYDEAIANDVYDVAKRFVKNATALLESANKAVDAE